MKKLLSLLLLVSLQVSLLAEIQLSSLFSDGAVLQRNSPIPVWGWAAKGTPVTISFKGQTKSAKADSNGKWMIKLNSLKADAQGAKMTIKVGNESKTISDLLIGEVWICGGQSNMDFTLNALTGKARDPKHEPIAVYIRNEIATANDPLLRQIKVARKISPEKTVDNFSGAWEKAIPNQIAKFTATGYFYARELRQKLNVPVGLINCNWGGTRVEPWIPMNQFQTTADLKAYYNNEINTMKAQLAKYDPAKAKAAYEKQLATWKEKAKEAKASKKKAPRRPRLQGSPDQNNRLPSSLYNGMMHTVVPYAAKGAIWYQGESNAGHLPEKYKEHFTALIEGWRKAWGQDKFYFYWCQLAQFKSVAVNPVDKDGWVTVCDQQRLTMELPDTGMAVLNDIGEAKDIHPKNKIDAGKRLSRWALKQAYGQDLVYSGPLYKSSKIEGNKILITFSNTGSGLMVGKKPLLDPTVEDNAPLKRFQICGSDNKWMWAEAKIISNDTIEVSHKDIKKPVEVRYAWAANAEGANLYNKEGLPASLFKTR